jgi:hypothetical protein
MAAGALALVRPAVAEGPQAPQAPATAEEATVPAEQARLEEVRVSLAWLTDPATFPYELTACVRGGSLEAGGTVPDAAVKEMALKLARQHTSLPVVDALEVRPVKAAQRMTLPAAAVQRSAAGLLSVAVGARGRDLTAQARPDGQVTVRGSVVSLEDKLYVSRRLRQVAGCTSVVNRLTVAGPAAERPTTARGPAGSLEEKLYVSQQLRQAGGRAAPQQPAGEAAPPAAAVRVVSVTPAPAAPASEPGSLSRLAPSLSASEADLHLPVKGQPTAAGNKMAAPAPKAAPVVARGPEAPAPGPVPHQPATPPGIAKPAPSLATTRQPAPAPAYATSPTAVVPARLRQRVLAACGDQALAVQVLTTPDQSVRVRVRVSSYAAQVQLAPRIMQLPEMRAPNVHLEIQVAP